MSLCERRQENGVIRVPDSERQDQQTLRPPMWIENVLLMLWVPDSERQEQTLRKWIVNILSMFWCVLSVTVDPLFFYVPVINEERKCVALDIRLYIGSTCLRTVLDSIFLVNIIWQCLRHFANARGLRGQESQDGIPEYSGQNVSERAEMTGIPEMTRTENSPKLLVLWSLAINHVLAILPIPQVLLPIIFSKLRGPESLNKRKVLTAVVLFQYLPRAIIVYLSSVLWREALTSELNRLSKSVIAVKAGFNLFMFIVASHILGAFWYFLSVERETACWHLACENHIECDRSSFDCNHGSVGNYTFLNDYCPIQTPNTTVFDFGIFQGALQSGIVASMDFPRKIVYCFWWGLRNLSSFGSNLQTSPHFWENCFSVLTSISGLLLFMFFLGRLQMYMQWEASRPLQEALQRQLDEAKQRQLEEAQQRQRQLEEAQRKQQSQEEAKQLEDFMQRWKLRMKARRNKIIDWIDRQPRLYRCENKKEIICLVDRMFAEKEKQIMSEARANLVAAESKISPSENEDIDAENPLTHLPVSIRRDIRQHLCLPLLQKVPPLQNKISEDTLKLISRDFLKEVYYNENSYIAREGEPLDALLFITQGIVWTYTSSPDDRQTGILKTDDFYGDELLEWMLQSPNRHFVPDPSNLPFSTRTLRCHTKVEAFALTAGNIQHLLDQHWPKFRTFRFDRLIRSFLGPNTQAAVPRTLDESDQKAKKAAS